jgi:hypothetical protein
MKMILLKILVVLVAIIAVICIIAAFTPEKYTIKREIKINQPVEKVYNYVRFHKNQKQFNQWLSYDPNAKIQITGVDGQAGSILHFESKSKKAGTGEWNNTQLIENKEIDFKIKFIAPYAFTANGSLFFKAVDHNKSTILWEYHSGMNWPMNITLLFMDMDKIIGADIQSTLDKIKMNTEKL